MLHSETTLCYLHGCPEHEIEDHMVFYPEGELFDQGAYRCGSTIIAYTDDTCICQSDVYTY